MSALPDNHKIKPQQRLFFLLILLFGLPAHFLPLIRFFCFKHFHSLFHFSLFTITYNLFWGISAVGSAQHWQCWGQGFESPMLHQRHVAAPDHQGRTVICQTPYRDGEVRIWTRILCQVGKIPEMQMLSAFPGFFIVVLRGQNQNSDLKNLFKKSNRQ